MKEEKDPQFLLQDILECCELIISNVNSVTLDEFEKNINLQDAVIRRFEVIGEAVKNIPTEFRKKNSHIVWKEAAAFRDVLIHDYPDIVLETVYYTGKEHLPTFRDQIKQVLDNLNV